MNPIYRKLAGVMAEGLLLALCVAAIPLIVTQDRHHFYYGSSEHSLTEIIQAVLVLFSAAAFWFARKRRPGSAAWLMLVAGFFCVMLIRELDYYFDTLEHGSWVYLAVAVTIAAVIATYRAEGSVGAGLLEFSRTPAYVFVLCGLIIVLFFSRLLGSSLILEPLMGGDYNPYFKTALQEGVELLGHVLVAWGAARYLISRP